MSFTGGDKKLNVAIAIIFLIVGASIGYGFSLLKPTPTVPVEKPRVAIIQGKVTDATTNEPIPKAFIVCNGFGAITKEDGSFSLKVEVGSYTIIAFASGYEEKTVEVDATEEKTYIVDISLVSVKPLKYGGTLKVGLKWDTHTFDPHFAHTTPSDIYVSQIFEPLVVTGFNFRHVPCLATHWEMPNPLTYVFYLRRGITFHDGTPFNATAVVYSFNRVMDPNVGSPFRGEVVDIVEEVEMVDLYTVKFKLKRPDADFLTVVGMIYIVSPSAVEKWGEEFSSHPAGTGPFKLKEWVPGSHTVFTANDNYWGRRPYIDELVFRVIPEDAVRLVELETGNIHITQVDIYEEVVTKFMENPDYVVGKPPNFSPRFIAFNLRLPIFQNVKVRKAICYALNPKEIVDSIYLGFAEVAYGPICNHTAWWNPNLPHYEYDPEKAKELLAEAGYPEGFEVTLLVGEYGRWPDEAIIIQHQLQKVGIKVNVQVLEWAAYMERLMAGDFEITIFGGGMPSPDAHLRWFYKSNAPYNFWGINDSRIDELIALEQTTPNFEERKTIFEEIHRLIYEEAYLAYLYVRSPANLWSAKVKGYHGDVFFGPIICSGALGINVWIEKS